MMKLLKLSLLAGLTMAFMGQVDAQNQEETKIVVIEKVTDNEGKVVTRRIEKSGEEAERYIKEKKEEMGLHLEKGETTKTIRKEMSVEVEKESMKEEKKVKIIVTGDDGEKKVMEWDGQGEMPEEMKKHMDEEDVDIEIIEGEDDMVVRVETMGKPRLGVVPENHVDGVEIISLIEGSAAEKASLQEGDIIFKINGEYVGSTLQLRDRLDKVEEGSEAEIEYLRDGKEMKVKVRI